MAGNTFGKHFQIMSYGESHGFSIGGIVDGVPAGLSIDLQRVQYELDRRRPGQSDLTTSREEKDEIQFLSGILEKEGEFLTTGTPIGFQIRNSDAKSLDYSHVEDSFRPSHADYTYSSKYGIRDHKGGGRSSARETISRVVAGAIAQQLLEYCCKTQISAYVERVHDICMPNQPEFYSKVEIDSSTVRCPNPDIASRMIQRIEEVKDDGDSVGGAIVVVAQNVETGLGEPVFDKLNADLAKALMSIPAVKSIEFGSGLSGTLLKGSQHNDEFTAENGEISTKTNNSGGIQGGISNGENIIVRISFKPTSTILKPQNSVNSQGEKIILEGKGRHDPCVLPRAVPIVESMVAITLADHYLRNKTSKI